MVIAEGEDNTTWTFFVDSFREKYLGEAQLSGKIQEFFGQRPILLVLLLHYLLLVDFTFVIDTRLLRLFIHLLVTQHSYELTQLC